MNMNEDKNKQFDGLIYVTNKNYEVIYINKAMRKLFPDFKLGEKCYEAFAGCEKLCRECPLRTGRQRFYYNQKIEHWLKIDVANIEWPGCEEECYIFKLDHVTNKYAIEYFLSLYDVNGHYIELNIDKNECFVLYGSEEFADKEIKSTKVDDFRSFAKELAEKHVHALDRKDFLAFWDLDTLEDRLNNSWQKGILINEFIEKDREGCWQVVLQLIIDLPRFEDDDHIVRCFSKVQRGNVEFDNYRLLTNAISKMGLDNLTGLARDQVFFDKAKAFIDMQDDGPYCMIAIDIPNFWIFNKQNSHDIGDHLLMEIANVLKDFQLNNNAIAGYFGSDDFAIVMPTKQDYVVKLFNDLNACLAHYEQNIPFTIKMSGYTIDNLDISMNVAYDYAVNAYGSFGQFGNASIKWYNPGINYVEKNYQITKESMDALKKNEFIFYLQAQFDIKTGKISGAESLVRWNSPENGIIGPGIFIPVLEHNGLVSEIDRYVWEETIKWMGQRLKSGKKLVPISVNVSRIDVFNLDVISIFEALVKEYQVPRNLIKLEITESAFVADEKSVRITFDKLRKLGYKIMLDDFGSGLSSLCTLDNINVDFLKLDMELVRFRETNFEKKVSIVDSIVKMSKSLKLPLVAEGIETNEQLRILDDMGVEYGQGLLFAKALPVEEFENLLDEEKDA